MPQASTRTAPAPPPNPNVIVPSHPGSPAIPIPNSAADVAALRDRANELVAQRSAVNSERASLSGRLLTATAGPDATGLGTHIAQLDARLLTIESDIGDIGRAISAAPYGLQQTTTSTGVPRPYGQPTSSQVTAIAILSIIFVLAPLAFAAARIAIRRAAHAPVPQIPKDVSDRLQRMEQGIEAVAVEVERIGEGQRFVTQLMSDRAQRAALPEGVPRT
jgi:hypothetical protein